MFIVIFDKSGDKSLSAWHYEKLSRIKGVGNVQVIVVRRFLGDKK